MNWIKKHLIKKTPEPKFIFPTSQEKVITENSIPLGNSNHYWNTDEESVLFITGTVGTGKTVISREIFNYLDENPEKYEYVQINGSAYDNEFLISKNNIIRAQESAIEDGCMNVNNLLENLRLELEHRLKTISDSNKKDYKDNGLKNIIVKVNNVFTLDQEVSNFNDNTLIELIEKGKPVGINIIFECLPEMVDELPERLLNNLNYKIIFRIDPNHDLQKLGIYDSQVIKRIINTPVGSGIIQDSNKDINDFSFSPNYASFADSMINQ